MYTSFNVLQVEGQIRSDIQEKKLQVRQLVGDSYHDLISSADMVLSMAEASETVAAEVGCIQDVFAQLARSVARDEEQKQASRGMHMNAQQLELYGVWPLHCSSPHVAIAAKSSPVHVCLNVHVCFENDLSLEAT
jgi:hypothetical protein